MCQSIDIYSGGSPTGSGRTTSGSGQTAASTKAVGNAASESPLATDATDAGFSADLRAAIALHERAALGGLALTSAHVAHGNAQRGRPECLHERRVLGIEVAKSVDDGRVLLLGVRGDRRYLGR